MLPHADDFTVIQHHNFIRVGDGSGPLRHDEDRRAAVHRLDCLAERRVSGEVQCGSAVVKNEDFRLANQCAGNGQPLPLSAGEILAALRDHII